MSVAIEIVPVAGSLDMYGDPDSLSAYSLSGHVNISVSSPYSMFEHRRTARLLLHSITLTFEGQDEVINSETGYSAVRLCTVTREIAPCEPVELNNEGHEESDEPCMWNVVFNLPIPGWLPATTTNYSTEDVGVRYALYAEAKFTNLDDNKSNAWSFATLCSPFRSRVKSVDAQKPIILRRLVSRAEDASGSSRSSTLTYLVNSPVADKPVSGGPQFPVEVLSKIQVLASVPDFVDVESECFPVVVRMRTKDLDSVECQRIQATSIATNIIQLEKSRSRPSSEYVRQYPVPPPSQQPPNQPLRDAHPVSAVYDVGLYAFTGSGGSSSRSFSLLPPGELTSHSLGESNYPFIDDADSTDSPTWYTIETSLPFVQCARNDKSGDWGDPFTIRPSASSPLISVRHEISVELMCTYDVPGSKEPARQRLSFRVPVRFAHFATTFPQRGLTPPPSPPDTLDTTGTPSLPPLVPYVHSNLPAYSQLFDHNGDRKIDYSIPLPLYTHSSASTSSSSLELDATEIK